MNDLGTTPDWLDRAIRKTDWFRRPPSRIGGAAGYKEWVHFCIYAGDLDLLVNFSEVDDPRGGARPAIARQTLLARTDRWIGGVEQMPGALVRSGAIHADFGERSSLRYEDGAYRLRALGRRVSIEADLTLQPISAPAPIHNVTVGDGPPIHWVVLPRLAATGSVVVAGRRFELDRAPAYHDHNWGYFGWGRDFAWEWGFGLPQESSNPFSLVFARLSNRALTRTRMQTLFVWHERQVAAAFRDDQIRIEHHGLFRPDRLLRLPTVMALVARSRATDVPARMTIEARSSRGSVVAEFTPCDVAQVIIPNDHDLGTTIIHEVAGDLIAEIDAGGVRGEIRCRTIFEFLGR